MDTDDAPIGICNGCKADYNVYAFGCCSSTLRDGDHKRTIVTTSNGRMTFTGEKCIPMLDSSWKKTTEDNKDLKIWVPEEWDYCDVLTTEDYLVCYYGGWIKVAEVNTQQQPAITIDWLRLYSKPTVSSSGRHVLKHPDAKVHDWAMPEELKEKISDNSLTSNSRSVTGLTPINAGNNCYMDDEGRYWVAVGPNVMNPNYKNTSTVTYNDMKFGTKLDIHVVGQHDGIDYYIPAVVGDVKNNTYPDGLYQTGVKLVTKTPSPNNADGSTVEFMSYGILDSSVNITNNYKLIEVIVYDGVLNY